MDGDRSEQEASEGATSTIPQHDHRRDAGTADQDLGTGPWDDLTADLDGGRRFTCAGDGGGDHLVGLRAQLALRRSAGWKPRRRVDGQPGESVDNLERSTAHGRLTGSEVDGAQALR
jgi:hypothetical protein